MKRLFLCYIAGLIAGDGHIEKHRPRIVLASKARAKLAKIRNTLGIRGSLFLDKSAGVWKYSLYSEELRDILESEFGIPAGNKSRRLKTPRIRRKDEIINYVAGWFDAEGWCENYN